MSHKHNYIAIMDDLLVHSKKENHLDRIGGPFGKHLSNMV